MPDPTQSVAVGLTDRITGPAVWVSISLLVVCGIAVDFGILTVRSDLNDIIYNVFIQYAGLAVAIERAAAVFVAMTRSKSQVEWEQRIRRVTKTLDEEKPRIRVLQQIHDREQDRIRTLIRKGFMAQIAPVENKENQDEYIGYLTAVKYAYEFQLARFQAIGRRYTSVGVLFAGIALAGLGLSLFDSMFEKVEVASATQHLALRLVDIVITGGLLGGGSAGIGTMTTKIAEWRTKG